MPQFLSDKQGERERELARPNTQRLLTTAGQSTKNGNGPGQLIDLPVRDSQGARSESASNAGAGFELLPAPSMADRERSLPTEVDPVVVQNQPQSRTQASRHVDQSVIPASAVASGPQPQPRSPGRDEGAQPRRHVVQAGETFDSLARTFYGSELHASLLWWANRGIVAWPEALRPGTTIVVPPLEQIAAARLGTTRCRTTPALPQAPVHQAAPAPFPLVVPLQPENQNRRASRDTQLQPASFNVRPDQSSGAATAVKRSRDVANGPSDDTAGSGGYAVHVVRADETLQSIAQDRLGDGHRSPEIAELNRDVLGNDSRLTPGQRLLLPGDAGPPRQGP